MFVLTWISQDYALKEESTKDTSLLSWQSVLRLCIFNESWFYWCAFSQHSKLRSLTHTLCVHFLAHVHVSHIDFISYISDLSVELDTIDVWLNPYFITLPQYVSSSILDSHLLFSSLKNSTFCMFSLEIPDCSQLNESACDSLSALSFWVFCESLIWRPLGPFCFGGGREERRLFCKSEGNR